ncbi:MAG: hypothetical protein J0L75_16520 [Spirochaetes bacterium]|nr:hypothetical protein [Spirochaetota bacterium]
MNAMDWLESRVLHGLLVTGVFYLVLTAWMMRRKKRSVLSTVFYYSPAIALMAAIAWTTKFTLASLSQPLTALVLFQVFNLVVFLILALALPNRRFDLAEEARRSRAADRVIITHLLTRSGPVVGEAELKREASYIAHSDLSEDEKAVALRFLTETDSVRRQMIAERLTRRLEREKGGI